MRSSVRLSLCMPSHLPLKGSRRSLENLQALSEIPGLEAVVSDNSGDSQKVEECRRLSNEKFRYLQSPEADALGNFSFCLSQATGEFVSLMSDDDLVVPLPGFAIGDLPNNHGSIGFRPSMALYTEDRGLYSVSTFSIDGVRAIDRIRQYFQLNGGANTTIFSCYKTALFSKLYKDFIETHPTRGGYTDWTIVLGLLSTGPLPAYPKLLYIYNNRNWSTPEGIKMNTEKAFTEIGLPKNVAAILEVLHALDGFAIIARKGSPLSIEEKTEAALFVLDQYFESFTRKLRSIQFIESLDSGQSTFLRRIIGGVRGHVDKIAACLLIVNEWMPGYLDRYREYMRQTLDRELLQILE